MKKIIITIALLLFNFCNAVSLDDKISQMIIIGFDGDSLNSSGYKRTVKDINSISGVILFKKNIKDYKELNKMIQTIKDNSKIPPFVAIDNEGGQVLRFNFADVKSAKQVSQMTPEDAHKEYAKLAQINHEAGINLNFAPCVDLEINKDSIIAKKERSYSSDYEVVSEYAAILMNEHNKYGIITTLKHFPGHGSIEGDTHLGFVDATHTYNNDELKPYYELMYNDKTTVMVSHIFNSNFDEKYPASLSEKTINDLLRNKMGFSGVVVSDDYDMEAIRSNYELDEIIVRAINAGVDILLFSNNLNYKDKNLAKKIHKIIKNEIELGNIKEETIDKAYNRIMALKRNIL